MSRKNCQRPDACVAGTRGRCPVCQPQTAAERAANAERLRRQNAYPEFVVRRMEGLVRALDERRQLMEARR